MEADLSSRVEQGQASFLPSGEFGKLECLIRRKVETNTRAVFYSAFDPRTVIGPYAGLEKNMPNCGIRTVGASFARAGFDTRIVFGAWNPKFDFRFVKINGIVPELFGVGSMQIHQADAHEKIRQAKSLGDKKPLIVVGGPHAIYQAWDCFSRDGKESADVAVSGEANVALEMINMVLEYRGEKESLLEGFQRARREGGLEKVKGLMYLSEDREVLFDTGKPLQVADLDEFPREIVGLSLIEPKHNGKGLSSEPIELNKLKRGGLRSVSVITSAGCRGNCSYCPIPERYERSLRAKSPERMVLDMKQIIESVGGHLSVFGTDDHALGFRKEYLEKLYGEMARTKVNGKKLKDMIHYGTEATVHQIERRVDILPLMESAGVKALWLGVEDLDAKLVKKGQSYEKTEEVFGKMIEAGIAPMPMMMHHDGQSREEILNQIRFLIRCGAQSMQVLYNMPSIGSRDYLKHYRQGNVLARVGGMEVEPYMFDGNYPVSSCRKDLLQRQNNLSDCYREFYNSKKFAKALGSYVKTHFFRGDKKRNVSRIGMVWQIGGRIGLKLSEKTLEGWKRALTSERFEYVEKAPESGIPIVGVE